MGEGGLIWESGDHDPSSSLPLSRRELSLWSVKLSDVDRSKITEAISRRERVKEISLTLHFFPTKVVISTKVSTDLDLNSCSHHGAKFLHYGDMNIDQRPITFDSNVNWKRFQWKLSCLLFNYNQAWQRLTLHRLETPFHPETDFQW